MELIIIVANVGDIYEVYREFRPVDWRARQAVFIVDYKWTPWPRKGGNLLW